MILLQCDRIDCDEEIEMSAEARSIGRTTIEVYTGEDGEAPGWRVVRVGNDHALVCPDHARSTEQEAE
jgi:hypothetical protein